MIGVGVELPMLGGRPMTPRNIASMPGVTTWAHWPLHPALPGTSLATVSVTSPSADISGWTKGGMVITGGQADPLGGNDAYLLTETTDGSAINHYCEIAAVDNATGVAGFEFWAKASGRPVLVVNVYGPGGGVYLDLVTDTVTGTWGISGATCVKIATVGDWKKYRFVHSVRTSITWYHFRLTDNGTTPYQGDGRDAVYLFLEPPWARQTRLQSIGDEGPRAAHLVQSTPANETDYNSWDASGSQGGIAGARHTYGCAKFADAIDATLGTVLNSTTHYVVTWSLNTWTPGAATARTFAWTNSGETSLDEVIRSAGPSTRTRARTGSAAAAYSGTGAASLRSRVVVINGADSSYYENGVLVGSATVASPQAITADRVRLFGAAVAFEALFLGGGVFVFSSAAAMSAALSAIHAMVARMRAIWGIS